MTHDELTQGMASTGHILLGNHVANHSKGPVLATTFGHGPDFHPGGLDPVVHGEHTLGIALGGCILEFTHIGGPAPSLITSHGQDFHLGS